MKPHHHPARRNAAAAPRSCRRKTVAVSPLIHALASAATLLLTLLPSTLRAQSTNEPPPFLRTGPSLTQAPEGATPFVKNRWMDLNGDGWDDLWCLISGMAAPKGTEMDKAQDTDGDSVSDYDEMLHWRDPRVKGPPLGWPNLTPEQIAEAAEKDKAWKAEQHAQKVREWPARQAALGATLRAHFDGKGADPEFIRNDDARQREAVAKRLRDGLAAQPALERKLDDIAVKYGIPRAGINLDGKGWTLIGESPSGPVYVETQNARAANTIRADDLWPAGLHSWQNTSLTRNLTGSGITTSIFEAGSSPGVLTTHQEFGGRATQVGTPTAGNHATAVADVIAGGGVLDVFRNNVNQGRMLRGVAYQSNVRGHDLNDFVLNTANSVSVGHRFSNHSYGISAGWGTVTDGVNYYWYWPQPAFTEDPRLGLYSPPSVLIGAGISSKELDEFVHTTQVQLPVFAAGNPNN